MIVVIVDTASGTYFAMEDARAVDLDDTDDGYFADFTDEERIEFARKFGWPVSARVVDDDPPVRYVDERR